MPVILYGILAIVIGLLFLFFGLRLFRTVLATTGFMCASLLTYLALAGSAIRWGPHGDLYLLAACTGIGCLGALLGLSIWMAALVAMGGLGGFAGTIYLLSWHPGLVVGRGDGWIPPTLIAVGTIVGALMAALWERAIVMGATSAVGAIAFCSGVDVFARTGFNALWQNLVRGPVIPDGATSVGSRLGLTPSMVALLGSCAMMAATGFLVQLLVTAPSPESKDARRRATASGVTTGIR